MCTVLFIIVLYEELEVGLVVGVPDRITLEAGPGFTLGDGVLTTLGDGAFWRMDVSCLMTNT